MEDWTTSVLSDYTSRYLVISRPFILERFSVLQRLLLTPKIGRPEWPLKPVDAEMVESLKIPDALRTCMSEYRYDFGHPTCSKLMIVADDLGSGWHYVGERQRLPRELNFALEQDSTPRTLITWYSFAAPPEVWSRIMNHLDATDLNNCSGVCRAMYHESRSPARWIALIKRDFPHLKHNLFSPSFRGYTHAKWDYGMWCFWAFATMTRSVPAFAVGSTSRNMYLRRYYDIKQMEFVVPSAWVPAARSICVSFSTLVPMRIFSEDTLTLDMYTPLCVGYPLHARGGGMTICILPWGCVNYGHIPWPSVVPHTKVKTHRVVPIGTVPPEWTNSFTAYCLSKSIFGDTCTPPLLAQSNTHRAVDPPVTALTQIHYRIRACTPGHMAAIPCDEFYLPRLMAEIREHEEQGHRPMPWCEKTMEAYNMYHSLKPSFCGGVVKDDDDGDGRPMPLKKRPAYANL